MGQIGHATPSTATEPSRAARTAAVARVLVVDSDAEALVAIDRALRYEGYVPVTAFDAAGALNAADRLGPFDLLITELHSTPVNGVELAQALLAREPELQVLYVTSCREALFAHDIPHSKDDDVIERPFSEEELIDAVSALLYWHRPRRAR